MGLETLPFVAATALALLLASVVRADGGRCLAAFGGALAATAPVVLLLTAPLPAWATVACDRMSFPHLAGAVACAAIGGIAMALQHARPAKRASTRHDIRQEERPESRLDNGWGFRLVTLGVAGVAATGFVVALFPQCAGGPYAELAPEVRYWLDRVSEARSLPEYFADAPGTAIGFATLPFVGALVAAARLRRGGWTDPRRLAVLVFALSGVLVCLWQIRGLPYAALVGAIAMLPVTQAASARAAQVPRPVTRLALRLCVPVAYTAAFILPILVQVIIHPSDEDDRPGCELDDVLPALQDSVGLGRDVLTIAAPINLGAEILLRTHHQVLAAPYHRNARGLADIRRIYAGTQDEAVATATRRGVDAIIFCPRHMDMMAYPDRKGFLSEQLGEAHLPDWLLPVARRRRHAALPSGTSSQPSFASVGRDSPAWTQGSRRWSPGSTAKFEAVDARFDSLESRFDDKIEALADTVHSTAQFTFLILALVVALGLYNAVAPHFRGREATPAAAAASPQTTAAHPTDAPTRTPSASRQDIVDERGAAHASAGGHG